MAIRPRTGVFIGVAAVAVLAIAGTVTYNAVQNSSNSSSDTVTWWVPDWDADVAADLVADFEDENPGITVKIVETTGDTVANRVSVALNSGDTPDLITDSIARIPSYVAKDQLADLSDLYDGDLPKDDFAPGLLDALTVDGATYAVPYRWATNALIYNPDLFEAAGIDSPPTTWDEFEEDAKLLTQGDVVGTAWPMFGEPNDLVLRYLDFALSDGSTIENGMPQLTADSAAAAASLIGDSVAEGWASKSSFELDNTGIRELFLQGRVAMYPAGVFDVDAALAQGAPVATALLPGPDGPGTAQGVGWAHIVPEASTHQESAKKLAAFLGAPESMAALTLTFPARISASDDAKFTTPEREAYAEQLADHSIPAPNDPRWTASVQAVHDTLQQVALGQISSDDAGAAIQQIAADAAAG